MARIVEELFEGADETLITTGNSVGNAVSGDTRFDTAQAKQGASSARFVGTGAWWSVARSGTLYARWYVRVQGRTQFFPCGLYSGGTQNAYLRVNTAGTITVWSGTVGATTTTTLPLDSWSRLELRVGGGSFELRVFTGAATDSTTATEVLTGTATSTYTDLRFGHVSGSVSASWTTWMDAFALDDSVWVGPYVPPAPPPATGTLSATLPRPTVALTGTVLPSITGGLTVMLPRLTAGLSGVSLEPVTGSLAVTLPRLAATTSGLTSVTGALDVTLPAMTAGLSGVTDWGEIQGTIAATLPALTTAATGSPLVAGAGAPALLPELSVALSGDVHVEGGLGEVVAAARSTGSGVPLLGLEVALTGVVGELPPPPPRMGGYVRHRDRMVQESVYEDLRDTLIACRWLAGTTTRPVADPSTGVWDVLTVANDEVYPLLEGNPINLIDYFPEAEGDNQATALNTFALNNGHPEKSTPMEMGSNMMLQPYVFNMAFYAISDAVAMAVLNDLRDRYLGRIVRNDTIELYDFNAQPERLVVRMEVESFRTQQNTGELNTPAEVHLYFAELVLSDFVDPAGQNVPPTMATLP